MTVTHDPIDPVERLARALYAKSPSLAWDDCAQDWDEATSDVQDLMRADACALLAQITPAIVAEVVAKERAACADLAQLTAQGFHEAASLPDVPDAEISLRKTAAKAALLVEIQIRMRGGEAHQIDMGAAQ